MKKTFAFLLAFSLMMASLVAAENFVGNGSFEDGEDGWKLIPGAEIARGFGFNGNGGLKVVRTQGMPYRYSSQDLKGLEVGKAYRLSAMIKADGVVDGKTSVAVEYFNEKGEWLGGAYKQGPNGTEDWLFVEVNLVIPEGCVKAHVLAYLEKTAYGTAYFDNIAVEPIQREASLQMVYPVQGRIKAKDGLFRFCVGKLGNTVKDDDSFKGMKVRLTMTDAQEKDYGFIAPVKGILAVFPTPELSPGKLAYRAELLDALDVPTGAKAEGWLDVVDEARETLPKGAAFIDEYGRTIVDGKPYLPIGLYMGGVNEDDDLELIYDSDYNCLMPYASSALALKGEKDKDFLGNIRRVLDELDEHGVKVIFSVKDFFELPRFKEVLKDALKSYEVSNSDELVAKLVTAFREHPAILSWYDNDEIPLSDLEKVSARRKLINALDPYHPVWGVLCDALETPFFGATCDVLGVDPYPIMKQKVSDNKRTVAMLDAAKLSGQPFWAVPQIFNWAVYQAVNCPELFDEWIQPRPDQMRGIILLEAIRGARGFVNYSFFDLKRGYKDPQRFKGMSLQTREEFLWHWNEAKELATMLKNLSPWILSKDGPTEMDIQLKGGKAEAAVFLTDDDCTPMVMVASIGPENVDGEIRLPRWMPPMKSLYGHAKETSPGVWHFSGNDIWGEVLVPVK